MCMEQAHGVVLRDVWVHHIANNADDGNAHGIVMYGNQAEPLRDIIIENCLVEDCVLGASEALVLNGNIDHFTIRGNTVRNCNNIGIDVIGYEGLAPVDDWARNGIISGNIVQACSSAENPAYRLPDSETIVASAAGIYVDGAKRVLIYGNTVIGCDFGIEVASEHPEGTAEYVVVHSNIIRDCLKSGLLFGGYDAERGVTQHSQFIFNTLINNDHAGANSGAILVQQASNNLVSRNVVITGEAGLAVAAWQELPGQDSNIIVENVFIHPNGQPCSYAWAGQWYDGLAAWQTASGLGQETIENPKRLPPFPAWEWLPNSVDARGVMRRADDQPGAVSQHKR